MKFVECKSYPCKICVSDPVYTKGIYAYGLFFCALGIFDDSFIDHLFDLVEQTRGMHDETFNYSVIKLIVGVAFIQPLIVILTLKPPGFT